MRNTFLAMLLLAITAGGASAAELTLEQRFEQLDARVQALEAEARALREQAEASAREAQAAKAELAELKASAVAVSPPVEPAPIAVGPVSMPQDSGAGNPNAFNPAISIVLDGRYAHHSLDPESYEQSGFPLVGEGGPGEQGLALGESEISFAANIDDKFYGQLTVALESEDGETEVGIEEAYVDTLALPAGFGLRAGRFFSNIGYLNSHHAHTDSFVDRPLAYQAFLGNQYIDDGLQLRWVAPLDFFLELGGELLRGESYPAGGAAHSGVGARSFFAHAGGDVGVEHSWLAGVSLLQTDTEEGEDGFTGDGDLYLADLTWKWAPDGNVRDGGITLRGEYFLDDRDGVFIDPDSGVVADWDGTRRGAYVEGVWRINRRWETGYRHDRLRADDDGPYASDYDPLRNSLMLTWRPSEFSLVRLQVSRDEPNPEDTDNAVYLQYQMNLGAHGAHKF